MVVDIGVVMETMLIRSITAVVAVAMGAVAPMVAAVMEGAATASDGELS